jgi:hypothetical protein
MNETLIEFSILSNTHKKTIIHDNEESVLLLPKQQSLEEKEEYISWCKYSSKKYWLPVIVGGISTIIGIPAFIYIGTSLVASGSIGLGTSIALKLSGIFGSFGLGAYTGSKYANIQIDDPNIWKCILFELDIAKIKKECLQSDFKLQRSDKKNFIYIILHDIKNPIHQIYKLHEYIYTNRQNNNKLLDMRDLLRNIYSLVFYIYDIKTDDIYMYDELINEIDRIIIPLHYHTIIQYCEKDNEDDHSLFYEQFYAIKQVKPNPIVHKIRDTLIIEFRKISNCKTPIDKSDIIYNMIDTLQQEFAKHNKHFTTDDLLDNWLYILHQSDIDNIFIEFKYMEPFLSHKKNKYGYIITNFEMLIQYILQFTLEDL